VDAMEKIIYAVEKNLSPHEFRQILLDSTLGERRPVNDIGRLKSMVEHANLIVTARQEGHLIGVSRSVSDFSFCTYLSDLAVHTKFQQQGIGRELIRQTKKAAPLAKLILLSAPAAVDYYPKIGMIRHEHCYYIDSDDQLK
jgi:ribosomal protein S18 acetylase RimI-like enzyme